MEPLTTQQAFEVPLRFGAGVVAGVIGTLVMDAVMARLPEGPTPPAIASGVLTDKRPREAPDRLATVVHYLAGSLTGPLFVWLLFTSEGVIGQSIVATLAAIIVLYLLMVGFFAVVVLPRSHVATHRVRAIRRDWAISAAAYCIVLVSLVTIVSRVL